MNITSLPAEVLCEISERAISLDGYSELHEDGRPKRLYLTKEPPLNVSHTSRAWRQLALSDSRLWARIMQAVKDQDKTVDIRMLSLWLERSADAIIDFNALNISVPVNEEDFLAWYTIVARKQSCWGKARFIPCYGEYRDAIEPAKLYDLSKLTEWKIWDEFPFALETHRGNKTPLLIVPVRRSVDQPIAPLLTRLSLEWLHMNHETYQGWVRAIPD